MTAQPTPVASEYARLQAAAVSLLETADQAARNGDTATEQRAEQAAGRCLAAARNL